MGWRYRRSIKIFPGLKMNLSKSGTSFSLGRPGATLNVGKRGVRSTLGIPGTGISYVTQHSLGRRARLMPTAGVSPPQQQGRALKWVVFAVLAGAALAAVSWL